MLGKQWLDPGDHRPAVHLEGIRDVIAGDAKQQLNEPVPKPVQDQFRAGIVHHPAAPAESRPKNAIVTFPKFAIEGNEVGRAIRPIRHQDSDDITPELGEAPPYSKAETIWWIVVDATHDGVTPTEGADNRLRPIHAIVVHHQDLIADVCLLQSLSDTPHRFRDVPFLVMSRYHDGEHV